MRRLRPSLSRHNVELSVVMDAVAIGEDLRALGRDGSAEGAPLTGAASILSTRMLLMPAFAGRAGDSRWKIGHRLSAIGRSLGGAAMLASSTVNEGESIHFQAHKRVFLQGQSFIRRCECHERFHPGRRGHRRRQHHSSFVVVEAGVSLAIDVGSCTRIISIASARLS